MSKQQQHLDNQHHEAEAEAAQPISIELDAKQLTALEIIADLIEFDLDLKCLAPVLESVGMGGKDQGVKDRKGREGQRVAVLPPRGGRKSIPIRPATRFKYVGDAAEAFNIDWNRCDISHRFHLTAEYKQDSGGDQGQGQGQGQQQQRGQLSENCARLVQGLKANKYVRRTEGGVNHTFNRTILDLIIIDRLRHLEDKDPLHHLQCSTDVVLSVVTTRDYRGKKQMVTGRADWAVGYGPSRQDTGDIFLVVQEKPYESAPVGLAQLVVCMAAVHEARKEQRWRVTNDGNRVYGLLSNGHDFRFAFLDENKRLSTSGPLQWWTGDSSMLTIIAYIDMMLTSAIESSPSYNTAAEKESSHHRVMRRRFDNVDMQWRFGPLVDDGVESEDEEEENREEEEASKTVKFIRIDNSLINRVRRGGGGGASGGSKDDDDAEAEVDEKGAVVGDAEEYEMVKEETEDDDDGNEAEEDPKEVDVVMIAGRVVCRPVKRHKQVKT